MAKQIKEILIDDLDGGEAAETVSFAIDGVSYEIDLSDVNAKKLRDAMSPFAKHARKAGLTPGQRKSRGPRTMTREKSSAIRTRAKEHDLPVSERGRIAATVVEKYEAAH
jgi:hypothetical protein